MFMGDIFVRVVSTVGSKVAILWVPGDAGVEQVGGAGPVAEGLTRTLFSEDISSWSCTWTNWKQEVLLGP